MRATPVDLSVELWSALRQSQDPSRVRSRFMERIDQLKGGKSAARRRRSGAFPVGYAGLR
jgi:hypothetical protein